MKALYFTWEIPGGLLNQARYLAIPEKKICIALDWEEGETKIKDLLHGRISKQEPSEIENIQNGKVSNFKYVGEVKLPQAMSKEIDSLIKKYETLEKHAIELAGKGNKSAQKLEKILKKNKLT